MITKEPFTFDLDAARRWLTDGEEDDGTTTVAYDQGIDSDWGAPDGDLDQAIKDLGWLLAEAPSEVLGSPDGYDLMVDALVDSESYIHLMVVGLPGGVNLAGHPTETRHLIELDRHDDSGAPGVERALGAMAEVVAGANRLVNRIGELVGGEWLPRHVARAREILAAPVGPTPIDTPDGPLIKTVGGWSAEAAARADTIVVLTALAGDLDRQGEDVHADAARRLARGVTDGTLQPGAIRQRLRTMRCPQTIRPRIEQAAADLTAATVSIPDGYLHLWQSLLGPHEHSTLTVDGRGSRIDGWCTCYPAPATEEWVRYERYSPRGREAHGYLCPTCRFIVQSG